ncbi:MAG: alpha-L-fucosidase [Acidobacteriaceae bacterium]|nr:alpha-L-fucosidase [Acidobacteriaceae bacterium]
MNHPDRLAWFRDQGFGLFIHWGVDSQLGSVISHSLVGASDDYVERYFSELPKTFDPYKFHPQDWAVLAKLAGVRYVVFTTKHHSGFCMFPTATTTFGIMETPFHRDITADVLAAFRAEGIAPGVYFSPDDFHWLHDHGITIQRNVPEVSPEHNPELLAYDQAQVHELLTHYGPISVIFFDGPASGLKDLAWKLQPDIVVTRGALETPEQYVPGIPLEGAWESNLTMGTQWQYKPTNETYKSGTQLIRTLIETRAKGGNLLLNIGPKPDGELAIEQESRLREIALWMFVNSEAIYSVRPWVITNENDVWFTRKKDSDTVYAIVASEQRWKYGEWKDLTLHSVRATEKTEVSVLGQNDKVLEYRPDVVPKTTWRQESDGLHIRAMHAQRLYNNREWPNPIVLKITNAQAAMKPPQVKTETAKWDPATNSVTLTGVLRDLGEAPSVEVGFQYQHIRLGYRRAKRALA